METNILGLPSLTGYTPLKAFLEGQVLKYDFRGVGPVVLDKSGNGNLGRLKPKEDPPRRKIVSWFPFEMALKFAGNGDRVVIPFDESLDNFSELTVLAEFNLNKYTGRYNLIVQKSPWAVGSFLMYVRDDGVLKFGVQTETGRYNPGTKNFDLNRDIKVRGVFDGESVQLFVDGNLENETSVPKTTLKLEKKVMIGDQTDSPSGMVKKVSIFNKVVRP